MSAEAIGPGQMPEFYARRVYDMMREQGLDEPIAMQVVDSQDGIAAAARQLTDAEAFYLDAIGSQNGIAAAARQLAEAHSMYHDAVTQRIALTALIRGTELAGKSFHENGSSKSHLRIA